MPQITDVDISELIDLRQNTMALNASREKRGPSFLPPGIHIPESEDPALAQSVDLDNELLASKESSPNRKSPNVRESTKSIVPVMQEEPEIQQTPKKVKDGVDILKIDADKPLGDCESSLELILITLSKAFNMKPKQAAALLTNNNQYLITACIKGAKNNGYEPLTDWYQMLIQNSSTLSELLTLEQQQLPQSSK